MGLGSVFIGWGLNLGGRKRRGKEGREGKVLKKSGRRREGKVQTKKKKKGREEEQSRRKGRGSEESHTVAWLESPSVWSIG